MGEVFGEYKDKREGEEEDLVGFLGVLDDS